jgi:hypothetical protein
MARDDSTDAAVSPAVERYRAMKPAVIAPHVEMPDYGKYSAFMRRATMERYRIEIDPGAGTVTWRSGDNKPVEMCAWWARDGQGDDLPVVKNFVMVQYSSLSNRFYTVGKVLAVDETGRTLASTFEYQHTKLCKQWEPAARQLSARGLPLVMEPKGRWPMSGPWSLNRRHPKAVKGLWYRSIPGIFLTATVAFVVFLVLLALLSH